MKNKKIAIIAIGLIITLSIISIIVYKKTKLIELKPNDSSIAIMVEGDDGKYTRWTSNYWPGASYQLYTNMSTCKSGSKPAWNDISRTITMSSSKVEGCTLYFNKIKDIFQECPDQTNLKECFEELKSSGNTDFTADKGNLYIHTTEASAEDGALRYAGTQPNNYICFGAGSEEYNNGETDLCPLTNKYRIIGYYPFDNDNNQLTSSENADKWLFKIIKAEYPIENELGITKSSKSIGGRPDSSKIETAKENIERFSTPGIWGKSSLYTAFNDTETGYLKFLYGDDETYKSKWESMVETVNWNVGEKCSFTESQFKYKIKPKGMYDCEMFNNEETIDSGARVPAKVGVMYVNDYGFGAPKSIWKEYLMKYSIYETWDQSWLFTGMGENTITRNPGYYNHNFTIDWNYTAEIEFYDSDGGSRPVLYLSPDVQIIKDDTADGRREYPYKVSID